MFSLFLNIRIRFIAILQRKKGSWLFANYLFVVPPFLQRVYSNDSYITSTRVEKLSLRTASCWNVSLKEYLLPNQETNATIDHYTILTISMPANWSIKVSRETYAAYSGNSYITYFTTCENLIFQPHGYLQQSGHTPLLKRLKKCHTERFLRSSTCSIGTINVLHQEYRKTSVSMKPKSILPLNHLNSICALQLHNPEDHRECFTRGNFMPLLTFSDITSYLLSIRSISHCVLIHKIRHTDEEFSDFDQTKSSFFVPFFLKCSPWLPFRNS